MSPTPPPLARITSVDAYRGFVMLLMMAEVLHLGRMAKTFPHSPVWQFLSWHQSHVEWRGCSLHDLIQPSFSFLVGVALPFSIASRVAKGQSFTRMTLHAVLRAVLLILLGVFLRSMGKKQTNWTFEDTLSQIGLGYVFLFLLGFAKPVWRWVALSVILVGYWLLFAAWPAPAPDFDYTTVGVKGDWGGLSSSWGTDMKHPTGFAAHWDKNTNPAYAFEQWLYPHLPRTNQHNGGGYATLSFIPTLGTMILGLIAGTWLKEMGANWRIVGRFVLIGLPLLAAGYALDHLGICPNVKRIWTPSWVLFSGGWCFLLLALFTAATDAIGYTGWSYPLRVIGANSIVAYCGSHLIEDFVLGSFRTHFGPTVFQMFGTEYEPFVSGVVLLLVYWLILWWMYRNRIFVRI
ncbi:acyltransferase family protein [Limnoglobus roseus]|uniref:Integral membrane acyltransferase n=1 Tax=Limnoglobus roseus TaxID=2598579 RepID=A0A5C1A646_9BACT|nr:integral membrane acyltransferase [Limnoglobus roseus]